MAIEYNDIYPPITPDALAMIPEEMKKESRWICWGSDKVPVSISTWADGTHFGIDTTRPENWGTFNQAAASIGQPCFVKSAGERFHVVGIGFVVGDGWFCADLDGGKLHQGKEDVPASAISDAISAVPTYAETSLSGCGYHIFGKCDFNTENAERNRPHRGQDGNPVPNSYEVEFFTRRKFIAITGRKVPGASEHATECSSAAKDFYHRYILDDWNKDESKRTAERAKVAASIPVNVSDAEEMFLLNYPEILAASDSSNFKRGGPGVTLPQGCYSWIGAVKAMQEIGIPEDAILEWCRRGSNFKSEKDVRIVLDKSGKRGAASVAGIVEDAKAHGWKPNPEKLTGEYKASHDAAEAHKKDIQQFREKHRDEHRAALAAIGIHAEDPYIYTWTYSFNGTIDTVTDKATGEIVYTAPAATGKKETIKGITVNTVPGAAEQNNNGTSAEDPEKDPLVLCGFDDVEVKPTDYLFFPWFPRGKLTAIQGDSGSSKSSVMYAVGAKVSTGEDLLGVPCEDPGNVMFITIEDDAADIKIAFLDSGGDLEKLRRIRDREQISKLDLSLKGAKMIDKIIKEEQIKLLVLDPIQQFLSGDMNKANETRPQLARLMNIAAENNICIAFIQHQGKDISKAALHRGIGSVDIGAATRSMLQVVTDPDDDFFKIVFTVKNNTADFHDTSRAIRYRMMDHPGSFNQVTKKRERYHGHAEFIEILPEYNERIYKKAVRRADEAEEAEEALQFEYNDDPLVITARELVSYNPQGLFIGTDDLIQKITICCGRCPYEQSKSKVTGIYNRVSKLRNLMIDTDGIQADIQSGPQNARAYNWRGELYEPQRTGKTRGIYLTPVKNGSHGMQQTKI